jgi:hypothetical protein
MKAFFLCMLIVSVLAVVYDLWAAVGDMAHSQYRGRHDLLDTSRPQPEHSSPHLGLTPKELASCDPYFANAYEQAVYDGYKLGTGYFGRQRRYYVLAGLLFVSGCCGIAATRNRKQLRNQEPRHAALPDKPVVAPVR